MINILTLRSSCLCGEKNGIIKKWWSQVDIIRTLFLNPTVELKNTFILSGNLLIRKEFLTENLQ